MNTFTSNIYPHPCTAGNNEEDLCKMLALKCNNTNTNSLFYNDIGTFNVLRCA